MFAIYSYIWTGTLIIHIRYAQLRRTAVENCHGPELKAELRRARRDEDETVPALQGALRERVGWRACLLSLQIHAELAQRRLNHKRSLTPYFARAPQVTISSMTSPRRRKGRATPSPIDRAEATRLRIAEMMRTIFPGWPTDALERIVSEETSAKDINTIVEHFIDELPGGLANANAAHIFSVIQDAWNYLPHKLLGGRSPAELIDPNQKQTARRHQPVRKA